MKVALGYGIRVISVLDMSSGFLPPTSDLPPLYKVYPLLTPYLTPSKPLLTSPIKYTAEYADTCGSSLSDKIQDEKVNFLLISCVFLV